jgi:hypothetical protein
MSAEQEPRAGATGAESDETSAADSVGGQLVAIPSNAPQDGLTQRHRRRLAALRLPPTETGGVRDPEHPRDTRYHRTTTGSRAQAFKEGFARGAVDALRQIWPHLNDAARARAAQLAARYGGESELR